MTKRIVVSLAAGAFVPLQCWLAGFNFDHRGEWAFWCSILTIYFAGCAWFVPNWKD